MKNLYRNLILGFVFFIHIFYFGQNQISLNQIDNFELNKNYKLDFNYNWNNMVRLDKNIIPELEKVVTILNKNENLIAIISIKINNKGNEKWTTDITTKQRINIEKELKKIDYNPTKIKILSLGNKYFKMGYLFFSNLDVIFYNRQDVENFEEKELTELYLMNFNKKTNY
ncbi:hypothetical protein [Epilithonimonas xixisoli]|uniref:Uncharacterized protein n=1 Tax=Epilithonimonas xixisoli TaxID=1476462 RepID=A0A4R8I9X7_9FLAO|nr:hypothetical protein [Epilithonimonas xixisoli]TDX86464.1 hypothetical protein B0I22_0590 [Epilithonimonas xixisoli]